MSLGLTIMIIVGTATTLAVYLCFRQHLGGLAGRIAHDVQTEVDRIRQQDCESEDRLVEAFVSFADENAAIRSYQREQADLLTADTANQPWAWSGSELQRWADQTQRERCVAGRRSTCFLAAGIMLALWTVIILVTLVGLRSGGATILTPAGTVPRTEDPTVVAPSWPYHTVDSGTPPVDFPSLPTGQLDPSPFPADANSPADDGFSRAMQNLNPESDRGVLADELRDAPGDPAAPNQEDDE